VGGPAAHDFRTDGSTGPSSNDAALKIPKPSGRLAASSTHRCACERRRGRSGAFPTTAGAHRVSSPQSLCASVLERHAARVGIRLPLYFRHRSKFGGSRFAARSVQREMDMPGAAQFGNHRHRQEAAVGRVVQYFTSSTVVKPPRPCARYRGHDPLVYFPGAVFQFGFRPARVRSPMSMGSIKDSFASSMASRRCRRCPRQTFRADTSRAPISGTSPSTHPRRSLMIQHGEHGFVSEPPPSRAVISTRLPRRILCGFTAGVLSRVLDR